jgi:uncharacterized protein YjiS (DUF1127 family)
MDLSRLMRALGGALRAAIRYTAAHREFQHLDDHTLRDLGLSPSEFESYWAEAQGEAERTRLRLAMR